MPKGYGGRTVAAKKEKSHSELLEEMRRYGNPQTLPVTRRQVRLRTLEAKDLLQDAKMPDILTPLVVRSVYHDITDREVREYLGQERVGKEEALTLLDSIDYVVEKALVSGAKLGDLSQSEKRWIFRLVMTPAESLITFHLDEEVNVEPVDESEDVQEAAE